MSKAGDEDSGIPRDPDSTIVPGTAVLRILKFNYNTKFSSIILPDGISVKSVGKFIIIILITKNTFLRRTVYVVQR